MKDSRNLISQSYPEAKDSLWEATVESTRAKEANYHVWTAFKCVSQIVRKGQNFYAEFQFNINYYLFSAFVKPINSNHLLFILILN